MCDSCLLDDEVDLVKRRPVSFVRFETKPLWSANQLGWHECSCGLMLDMKMTIEQHSQTKNHQEIVTKQKEWRDCLDRQNSE